MGGTYLAIPVPARDRGIAVETGADERLVVEWLDSEGRPIAEPVELVPPEPEFVEAFGASAGPLWIPSQGDAVIPEVQPEGTRSIRVGGPNRVPEQLELEAVRRRGVAGVRAILSSRGHAEAPWRLAVVADGYQEVGEFERDLDSLWQELVTARPFKQLIDEGLVSVIGLLWTSPGGKSLFDARPRDGNPWIIYGTNQAVNAAVEETGERCDKVLVVMNRAERGGAGGFDSSRPSWTTNRDGAGERWTQIALHELGHAFGLADEYTTAGNGTPEPDPLEPNVSKDPDPGKVAWVDLVSIDNDEVPSLTCTAINTYPLDAIGTFQGARYDETEIYRPSYGCRMRWTTWEFCKVCSGHIDGAVRSLQP